MKKWLFAFEAYLYLMASLLLLYSYFAPYITSSPNRLFIEYLLLLVVCIIAAPTPFLFHKFETSVAKLKNTKMSISETEFFITLEKGRNIYISKGMITYGNVLFVGSFASVISEFIVDTHHILYQILVMLWACFFITIFARDRILRKFVLSKNKED